MPVAFEVREEEELILHQRTAQGAAILILGEGGAGHGGAIVEEGVGVQRAIAQELVERAVQRVGAGPGGEINHAA